MLFTIINGIHLQHSLTGLHSHLQHSLKTNDYLLCRTDGEINGLGFQTRHLTPQNKHAGSEWERERERRQITVCSFDWDSSFCQTHIPTKPNEQRISREQRMAKGLLNFLMPLSHAAKTQFESPIIHRREEQDKRQSERIRSCCRQLFTSLCGLNAKEWQDSTKQKPNRKRPLESSFQQLHVSFVLPRPSIRHHVTKVSFPCSGAYQVKSHSCQRGSQVGNVLF